MNKKSAADRHPKGRALNSENLKVDVLAAADSLRRNEFWNAPDAALFDRATIAAVRYVGTDTMEADAIHGGGPPYIRIGRRALYRKRDVLDWIAATGRRVESTAQLQLTTASTATADVNAGTVASALKPRTKRTSRVQGDAAAPVSV